MEFIQMESAQTAQGPSQPDAPSTTNSALLHYRAELQSAINSYRDNIFQLLMSSPTLESGWIYPYVTSNSVASPLPSYLVWLTSSCIWVAKKRSNHEIYSVTRQAKVGALGLHAAAMPLTALPPHPVATTNNLATKTGPTQKAP